MSSDDVKKVQPRRQPQEQPPPEQQQELRPQPPPGSKAPNPFDPANLRLDQAFTEQVPVKKLLTTVPVRRPMAQEFVRVHPDPAYRGNFAVIQLKAEREMFIVAKPLQAVLIGETVNVTIFTAINRQGTVFLWPVRLPPPDGRDLDWWRSDREAAEKAMEGWVRVSSNKNLGAYEIRLPQDKYPDPEWPMEDFWKLIEIGFKDHLINALDHPVIKQLHGRI